MKSVHVLLQTLLCFVLVAGSVLPPLAAGASPPPEQTTNEPSTVQLAAAGVSSYCIIYVPDDHSTIQAAVDAANPGDTIIVRAGTYVENVNVSKGSLTIRSLDGPKATTVQAASSSKHVFYIGNVDGVKISGFTIRGATADRNGGISLERADSNEIVGNILLENWVGVGLVNSYSNKIHKNAFSYNTYGIGIMEDESYVCAVAEAVNGADISVAPEETLDLLRSLRDQQLNPPYVKAYYEYSPEITSVLIAHPKLLLRAAKLIAKYMPAVRYLLGEGGEDLVMTEEGVEEMASFLRDLRGAVADRQDGMGAARGTAIVSLLNEFEGQARASTGKMFSQAFRDSVYFARNDQVAEPASVVSSNNIVYLNNFRDNTDNVRIENSVNTWNSVEKMRYLYKGNEFEGFLGNYWSDYAGSDPDGDGIGNIPYSIDASNRDNYPLLEPVENYGVYKPSWDSAIFVADVTIPDGTSVQPGEDFVKTWRLRNTGATTWTTDYKLVFDGGDQMGAPQYVSLGGPVQPNETVDISVPMTAPLSGGAKRGYWRMQNPAGLRFGHTVWVEVFIPYTPNPELQEAIDYLYNEATRLLSLLAEDSPQGLLCKVAEHGDFYRAQIIAAVAAQVMTLGFGFAGIKGDVKEIQKVNQAVQLILPGMEAGWKDLITRWTPRYEEAKYLFDATWQHAVETGNFQGIGEAILTGGMKYYAAALRNEAAKGLGTAIATEATKQIANLPAGFSEKLYPLAVPAIEMFKQVLTETRAELIDSMAYLSPEEQAAWAADLYARAGAAHHLFGALDHRSTSLLIIRDWYERHGWELLADIVLRWFSRSLATATFDGWGKLVVDGFWLAFDSYVNAIKMCEAARMVALAKGLMDGSITTSEQICRNSAAGLEQIKDSEPARTVTGQLGSISHYSVGYTPWWKPWAWVETASYSAVEVTNTGSEEATFLVMAQALVSYKRFGFDVGWTEVVQDTVTIPAGETVEVRVYYKNGSSGSSPKKDSVVSIIVLGINPAGILHVASRGVHWQPQRVSTGANESASIFVVDEAEQEIEVIDNPVYVFLTASPQDVSYEVQTWITNPLSENVTATIVHDLSDDWEVLSAPGASDNGSQLVWELELEAGGLGRVSFTFAYHGDLSLDIVVPSPVVTLETQEGEHLGKLIGNSPSLEPILPVTGSVTIPVEVLPGERATVSVSLQNLSRETTDGNIILSVTDPSGNFAYSNTQTFSLAPSASEVLDYLLPAFSEKGIYLILTEISHGGVTRVMWRDVLRVGTLALSVSLNATPADRVYPGDTITYIVSLNNTSSYALNGVTAEAIVPAGTMAHNISDDGQLEGQKVKWQLPEPLPAGGMVELSFQATVRPDAIGLGEARPLKSVAQASSDEALPVSSSEARRLLVANPAPVMGTITGEVDLYGQTDNSGVLVTVNGTYITTTASDGSFAIDVPGGTHTISFTYPRFSSVVYHNITVAAGEELSIPRVVLFPSLLADVGFTEGLDVDGVALVGARIIDVYDPFTEGSVEVPGGISSYAAKANYNSSLINILSVRGGEPPFDAVPTYDIDDVAGHATFAAGQTTDAPQPPITVAQMAIRLVGSVHDEAALTLTFDQITCGTGAPVFQHQSSQRAFRRGDARADSEVNIADALYIAQYLAGMRDLGEGLDKVHPVNAASARWDGDGDVIDIADVLYIAQYLAGLRDEHFERVL